MLFLRYIATGCMLALLPSALHAGSTGNSSGRTAYNIPEPLNFDLVRPLGAKKGELEANALFSFPLYNRNRSRSNDPFGAAPTSSDRRRLEWAPEIEYAPMDDFALEFELPFEGSKLEEYKLGLQWTIGTAFDDQYIHGFQALIEPDTDFRYWNSTLLYIAGIRFDQNWSMLNMVGGRMNLKGYDRRDSYEHLLNSSLFYDVSDSMVLGLEVNTAYRNSNARSIALIPQLHLEITEHVELQIGLGFGFESDAREQSLILRPVFTW